METELLPRQVLYTTHSPFMVEPRRFDRVRIVEDKSMLTADVIPRESAGTKVHTDVLEVSDGTLFPLQGALGYDICQTLFVGSNCLIVEGVADLLYLQTISGILQAKGCSGLDSRWTITPVGGIDKVPTFVALLGSQKALSIATLIDFQKSDQQTIENLYRRKLLEKKRVVTYAMFAGKSEADVEDMFDEQFYLDLVNNEYATSIQTPITKAALTAHSPRVIKRLEEYFATTPLKAPAVFNHYRPARYFAEKVSVFHPPPLDSTLKRFEQAFQNLNSLLSEHSRPTADLNGSLKAPFLGVLEDS